MPINSMKPVNSLAAKNVANELLASKADIKTLNKYYWKNKDILDESTQNTLKKKIIIGNLKNKVGQAIHNAGSKIAEAVIDAVTLTPKK